MTNKTDLYLDGICLYLEPRVGSALPGKIIPIRMDFSLTVSGKEKSNTRLFGRIGDCLEDNCRNVP